MQGMQSSSTPNQHPQQRPELRPDSGSDQRALLPAPSGPLEAAKRYLDRQRLNETALIAMDDEESDGRPAWLRRWPSEVRREIATERWLSSRATAPDPALDSLPDPVSLSDGSLEQTGDASATTAELEPSGSYTNGYSGQSIEAAFAFETVYHFETEFEAEATEDWLDLSSGSAESASQSVEAAASILKDSIETDDGNAGDSQSQEQDGDEIASTKLKPEIELRNALRAEMGPKLGQKTVQKPGQRSTAGTDVSGHGVSPDPQAVRAAIFRLAQDSAIGRGSVEHLESAAEESGFAEVARRVWGDSGEAESVVLKEIGDGTGLANFSDPESALTTEERDGLTDATAEALLANDDTEDTSKRDLLAQATFGTGEQSAQELVRRVVVDSPLTSADLAKSTGIENTTRQQLLEIPQQDLAGERSRVAVSQVEVTKADGEAGARPIGQAVTSADATSESSAQTTSQPALEERSAPHVTAGEAPALAHDAGNLLSALKLYSELLALSGVLHARHKHYAEDLKLLAARSEVLIDRLLASCSHAGTQARSILHGNAEVPVPSTIDHDVFAEAAAQLDANFKRPAVAAPSALNDVMFSTQAIHDERCAGSDQPQQPTPLGALETIHPVNALHSSGITVTDAAVQALESRELTHTQSTTFRREEVTTVSSLKDGGPGAQRELVPISLVDLLTRWGSLLSMIAHGSVEVSFGPNSALPIRVAEEAMERILVNLVHNAMTATRGGGAIRIGVGRAEKRRSVLSVPSSDGRARPGNRMVLTVDDSGCGMTDEQIERVLGTTQAAQDGDLRSSTARSRRGMGLQIVRELVAASGGQLAIYSRRDVGTRIEMEWPVAQDATILERRPPASVGFQDEAQRLGVAKQGSATYSPTPFGRAANHAVQGAEGAIAC